MPRFGPMPVPRTRPVSSTITRLAGVAARFAPDADPLDQLAFAQYSSGAGEQLGRWWIHEDGEVPIERIVHAHIRLTLAALGTLTG